MGSRHALITMPQSKIPRLEQSSHPQSSTYSELMPFNQQRKVFLSHSGRDKEFVRHLHEALCHSYHGIKVAFFDEDSIPKGEAVNMENILEEARTSELGVLVITDDFFTYTQNPMLELEAFVAAEVKLLPLFLTMSVEEFKAKKQRERWVKKWREWSAVDDKLVNLESWGHALSLVSKFSGLEFCKIATNQSDYIDKVVKEVICIIGPAIPLSKGGVIHGRDRLCKMVDDMYKEAASKRFSSVQNTSNYTQPASTSASNYGLVRYVTSDVVGIFGFAGLGKTTLCKWLCDYYHRELRGRVCYIDVGPTSASLEQNSAPFRCRLLQHVLSSLSPGNNAKDSHQLQHLSNDQLENLLRDELSSMKDPVFLAIDNIHSEESEEEADLYLGCKFPEGSKICITSRSEGILTNLSGQHECSFSVVTIYMPPLTFEEATDIFVQEFPELRKLGLTKQQEDDVNECVNMCTIHRKRYHPLMLKSLAAFMRWDRCTPHVDWKGRLAKVRSMGIDDIKDDVWKKVFSVFERTYELLSGEARKVFLDLAIDRICSNYEWINEVHSHLGQKKLEQIILQLKDMYFIESKWFVIEREWFEDIEVPDLLVDFGKYKARHEGNYVVVDASTLWPDPDQLPSSARHISISRVHCKASLGTQLDLRDVKGVEVLHLVDNAGLQEVLLSPTTCAHLRSLVVIVPKGTTLCCTMDEDWPSSSPPRRGGHFEALKWMQLQGDVSFQHTVPSGHLSERGLLLMGSSEITKAADPISTLGCPRNLEELHLHGLTNVQSIDLTTCANLKNVTLSNMPRLKLIHGLEGKSHLQNVEIQYCNELLALTISTNSRARYYIHPHRSIEALYFSAACGSRKMGSNQSESLQLEQSPHPQSSTYSKPKPFNLQRKSAPSNKGKRSLKREDASCSQIIEEENPASGPALDESSKLRVHHEISGKQRPLHEDTQEPLHLSAHRQKLTLTESDLQGFKFEELIDLRKLKLQYCPSLDRLPLGIFCQYSLRVLKLHGCSSLQELPMEMGRLIALESIDVHACGKLKGLPDSLSSLTLLEELSLCECTTLETLPDAMGKLSALKTLRIAGCENLSKLPDSTSKLVSLVQLELQGCDMLMELPSGMGYLTNLHALNCLRARDCKQLELKVLNLDDCSSVRRLPRKLGSFKKLRILSLANCHYSCLKALSSGICDLHSLVLLDLQGCSELQKLPGQFGMHLRALELLYLMECRSLRGLPSSFCRLKVLTELDMTGCAKLEWLPQQMGSLKALRKLKLAYCESLRELPDSVCQLGALVVMDVHGCHKLRELPAELGKLGKLEILDLRSCERLMRFPDVDGASELQSLRELDLRWSHLEILVAEKGDLYFLGPEKVKNFFKLYEEWSTKRKPHG